MAISDNFFSSLQYIDPKKLAGLFLSQGHPQGGRVLKIKNEVRPVDLYGYLFIKFGPPNGMTTLFRKNSSDNLIHWEWVLICDWGRIGFLGLNYRTEIQFLGNCPFDEKDMENFIGQLNLEIRSKSKEISDFKKDKLERWSEFINPYLRLRNSTDNLLSELKDLALDPQKNALPDPRNSSELENYTKELNELMGKYSKGLGICFGIRAMLPVVGEAFINLIIFLLLREDIKKDKRLRENVFRQQIDIRIKTLHINCIGFEKPIDYSEKPFGDFHTLINERNDVLHGNVDIEKLKMGEVYFHENIPVFKEYKSMWERTIGVDVTMVGLEKVFREVSVIERFIDSVLSHLGPEYRKQVEIILRLRDLGFNPHTGRTGVLFPDAVPDIYVSGF